MTTHRGIRSVPLEGPESRKLDLADITTLGLLTTPRGGRSDAADVEPPPARAGPRRSPAALPISWTAANRLPDKLKFRPDIVSFSS